MARPNRVTFRAMLWEYLGYPDDEMPERRRILYAIVILRLGLGLIFLLRGWSAVFATSGETMAMRLGDPARHGLHGAAADTALFLLGCTEIAVGVLLVAGAFTRVSAATGGVLGLIYVLLGTPPEGAGPVTNAALITLLGGLVFVVVCGSPFLSADRALDKLEEEERDRAPAVLTRHAPALPLMLRLGLAGGLAYFGLRPPLPASIVASAIALALLAGVAVRPVTGMIALAIVAAELIVRRSRSDMGFGSLEIPTDSVVWAVPVVCIALLVAGGGSIGVARWWWGGTRQPAAGDGAGGTASSKCSE